MRKITRLETFVIGAGPAIGPEGCAEPLACLRGHTDDGLVGRSAVFRVSPVCTVAACRSCSFTCGGLIEPGGLSISRSGAERSSAIEFAAAGVFDAPLRREL